MMRSSIYLDLLLFLVSGQIVAPLLFLVSGQIVAPLILLHYIVLMGALVTVWRMMRPLFGLGRWFFVMTKPSVLFYSLDYLIEHFEVYNVVFCT